MSDPRVQLHSAVTPNGRPHTHASANLPQQPHNATSRSPADSRPHATPRPSPKSATLSAIAMLPISTRGPSATSSFTSTLSEASPSSSSGIISNTGSGAHAPSSSIALQTQSPRKPRPTPQADRGSAKGSLDINASRPASNAVVRINLSSDPDLEEVAFVPKSKDATSSLLSGSSRSASKTAPTQPPPQSTPPAGSLPSSNTPITTQNSFTSPGRRSAAPSKQGRPPAVQSPRLQCVSAEASAPVAASTSPKQAQGNGKAPSISSPRSTATPKTPQASQARSQAASAPVASSPQPHPAGFGSETLVRPPTVPSVPLPITSSPRHPALLQAAPTLPSQPHSLIPAVTSPDASRREANVIQEEAPPQPSVVTPPPPGARTVGNPKQVEHSVTSNEPLHAAVQPAALLTGASSIDVSRQLPGVPSRKASTSSSLNTDQAGSSVLAATSPTNALDPKTLPDVCESTLSSSEPVDYELLLRDDGKFKPVEAVSCLEYPEEDLEELIIQLVENEGEPLVITDLHKHSAWNPELFTPRKYESLKPSFDRDGETVIVRNLADWTNSTDLPCPLEWNKALAELMHPRLNYHYKGQPDVSASLQPKSRSPVQTCYSGAAQNSIPLRRNLCSSLGQNLMVWRDPDATALWFITHPENADAVDRYLESKGGDPYSNNLAPQPRELQDAPFPFFFWRQRVGDVVLIPSLASHMVINQGGRTLKAAWSRSTVETLNAAIFHDLPLYQRVCRVDTQHVKPMIEDTLVAHTSHIQANLAEKRDATPETVRDLRNLLQMYDAILSDEYVPEWRDIPVEGSGDDYVECDFCGADVLHGYFECSAGEMLCALCYCQGRLCSCSDAIEALQPHQHWRTFGQRLEIRNQAAKALLSAEPTLALAVNERPNREDDDADQEPPLLPVEVLKEEDVDKRSWPLSFMAAMNLHKFRRTESWRGNVAPCKICKATLDVSQRYHCKPCGHSYCYGCLLHKLYIHPVHALAQNEPKQFHGYHRKASTLDYKEWKQDPFDFREEARAHFALIEAARTKMKCAPINKKCRIGFLDISDEHPNGLSGTLGVKRPSKFQVDKVKATAASSSPSTTPGSRKRPRDASQPVSAASPRAASKKKARTAAATHSGPMEEDHVVVQAPGAQEEPDAVMMEPSPTPTPQPLPTASLDAAAFDTGASFRNVEPTSSAPTVANGIRKFVIRAGKARPAPPSSAGPVLMPLASSSPFSEPSVAPLSASSGEPTVVATSSARDSTNLIPSGAVQANIVLPPGSSSTASALSPSAAVALPGSSAVDPSAKLTNRKFASPTEVVQGPTASTTVSANGPSLSPPSSAAQTLSPTSSAAAQTAVQGTLALATSVVAAGISSSPKQAAATSSPEATSVGLASLDNMNLRVVTEILRIFSHSNERMIKGQVAEVLANQANQIEELKKLQAEEGKNRRQDVPAMLQIIKQFNAEVKALTQSNAELVSQLKDLKQSNSELKWQQRKHEAEIKGVRQEIKEFRQEFRGLSEAMRSQAESRELLNKLNDRFTGFLDDIDRQAQAHLQAELASQPSVSDHFAPTSHTR